MENIIKRFFNRNTDMTSGNLFWKLILFALPAMLTTAMQLLYVTIDLTTVHYGDSAESMGAIASNSALINLIVTVFVGISLGANVILSEAKGAGNIEKASKVLHTSLVFSLFVGIAVGLLGFFISDNLLVMMGTEEHYLAKATLYLKIYFLGLPFLMVYNYCAQLLRAQGDSRTPFYSLFISGLLNVGFDCLFVFPLQMGVAGVGFATIIAEAISAFICFLVLHRGKHNYVSFSFKKIKTEWSFPVLWEVIRVGLPAGLQGFFFSLPNVFIQANLYTIDPGNVNLENGANGASNIEGYFYAVVEAIATSTMTFIAANVGAKKKENIPKCILYGGIWGTALCGILIIILLFAHNNLLSLFVDNEEAIEAGWNRLSVTGLFYIFDFTMIFTAGILRGFKRSTYPMVTTLMCCTVLRIVLLYTVFPLEQFHTVFYLYAVMPLTWIVATLSNVVAILIFLPKDLKKIEKSA